MADAVTSALLAWGLPVFGGLLGWLTGRRNARLGSRLSFLGFLAGSAVAIDLAYDFWAVDYRMPVHAAANWFTLNEGHQFLVGILADRLAVTLLAAVNVIATLVVFFSGSYLRGERRLPQYWAYLGLFVGAMQGIVLSDNLVLMFIFWELVGFSSYLLIGFWHSKPAAARASQKAFLLNRLGDAGFLIGLLILLAMFGTTDLSQLRNLLQGSSLEGGAWQIQLQAPDGGSFTNELPAGWLSAAGLCLFLGSVGKSAQFPLQAWLPDAMAGPTPVSALIHAATMVAAGVYLLARVYFLFTPAALSVMALIGALTAFMAGIAALTQTDIKRLLAFSTLSQLGYMVMGIGVLAYPSAIFHLLTHAFFKAGLFLAAGVVIHQMHHLAEQRQLQAFDAQDMRLMGGLRRHMPFVFGSFLVFSMALAGIPFFSGYLSKEGLLTGSLAWAHAQTGGSQGLAWVVPGLAFLTTGLTAYYITRQLLLVFAGHFRLAEQQPAAAGPRFGPLANRLRLPILLLGLLSLGVIFGPNPLDAHAAWLPNGLPQPQSAIPFQADNNPHLLRQAIRTERPSLEGLATALSLGLIALGAGWAYWRFRQGKLHRFSGQGLAWRRLSLRHFYLDELYDRALGPAFLAVARANAWTDQHLIDPLAHRLAGLVGDWTSGQTGPSLSATASWVDSRLIDGFLHGSAAGMLGAGRLLARLQTGRLQTYLLLSLLALLGILVWLLLR